MTAGDIFVTDADKRIAELKAENRNLLRFIGTLRLTMTQWERFRDMTEMDAKQWETLQAALQEGK